MEPIINRVLKELPFTPPLDLETFFNNTIIIFKPHIVINKEAHFSSYHFVIPASQLPVLMVDKKPYILERNKVFPTNPGQALKCETEKKVPPYLALFIDSRFINDICLSIIKTPEFSFANKSFTLNSGLIKSIGLFIQEYSANQLGCKLILDSLGYQIVVNILRQASYSLSKQNISNSRKSKPSVNKSIDFLMECYNSDFSLQDIARIANLSPYHFIRVFKSQTGKTPYEYLLDIKIEKSKELLKYKKHTITEVGLLCGFTNPSHFAVVFKRKTGVSPSDYRKLII